MVTGTAGARALGSKVVGAAARDRFRPGGGRRYLTRRDEPAAVASPDRGVPSGAGGRQGAPSGSDRRQGAPSGADGPQGAPSGYGPAADSGQVPPGTGAPTSTGALPRWLPAEPVEPDDDSFDTMLLRAVEDDGGHVDGPAASLVRPYSRTGGRTKPGHELDLEALVSTTVNGREASSSPLLSPEHVQVIGLCVDTTSVAEIAARLAVPIGVARVIIADMVDLGLVEVGKTSASYGDERDPAFLRRVLSGLQRL
jgi:hypothetical protein